MLRRYFIAGLLIWVPLWITLLVLGFIADLLDKTVALLPHNYQPDYLLGFHIPGLGILITLILVLATGIVATNFFGNKLLNVAESIMARIPIVRSLYSGSKQVMETILSPNGQSFRKVLLVHFPHQGMWSVAFQTGTGFAEAQKKTGTELLSVFIPTTPNPTAGFLMYVPKHEVIELDMTVEAAFKLIISLGVVVPGVDVNKAGATTRASTVTSS